jgi:energy-coupling factor transporter ATP-binding protein EcfA2
MRLVGLTIQNFRPIASAGLENLQPLSVILGPNNSGKSSFIVAIDLIRQACRGVAQLRSLDQSAYSKGGDVTIHAAISITQSEFESAIATIVSSGRFSGEGAIWEFPKAGVVRSWIPSWPALEKLLLVIVGTPANSNAGTVLTTIFLCLTQAGVPFRDLFQSNYAALSAGLPPDARTSPNVIASLSEAVTKALCSLVANRIRVMGPTRRPNFSEIPEGLADFSDDATDFARALYFHRGNQTKQYDDLLAQLQVTFPPVEILLTPPVGKRIAMGAREEGIPFSLPFEYLSSGVGEAIMILGRIAFAPEGSVITLEEPETHFHPLAIRDLVTLLQRTSITKQLLIVTHSRDLIYDIRIPKSDYWFVWRDRSAPTSAKRVDRETDINWIEGRLSGSEPGPGSKGA